MLPKYCILQAFIKLFVVVTGKDITLLQKKPSLRPEWNSCFDAHLYEGRAIRIILNNRPNVEIGQVTFTAQSLADRCKDSDIASIWVCVVQLF